MIEEFNVDSRPECNQLNLAHVARNKKVKKYEKQTMTVPAQLVR